MGENFMVGLPPGMDDVTYLLFMTAIPFGVLLGPLFYGVLAERFGWDE